MFNSPLDNREIENKCTHTTLSQSRNDISKSRKGLVDVLSFIQHSTFSNINTHLKVPAMVLSNCFWEYKLMQHKWRGIWQYRSNQMWMHISFDQAICFQKIYFYTHIFAKGPKNKVIHWSIVHNSERLETIYSQNGNWLKDRANNWILCSYKQTEKNEKALCEPIWRNSKVYY